MESPLLIRRATSHDARDIAKVHVASWQAAYTGLIPDEKMAQLDLDERERRWRNILSLNSDVERAWVATVNDETVGFAVTQRSSDEDVEPTAHELSALYLVPTVWRSGIGTALLEKAEHELRELGVREATLWVLEGNRAATSFYESRGWILDRRDPSFRDFGAAAVRYRKKL